MILNETDSMNPLFQSAASKHLLSKTPRFTPTATQVDVDSVKLDSYRTVLRLQKTYVRSVCKEMFNHKDQNAQAAGIVNWKRLTFSLTKRQLQEKTSRFWTRNRDDKSATYHELQGRCLRLLQEAPAAVTQQSKCKKHHFNNLSPQERSVLKDLRKLEVGFYIADKNLGPVIYSGDKFYEQCGLHLLSQQGHYIRLNSSPEVELDRITVEFNALWDQFDRRHPGGNPAWKDIRREMAEWVQLAKGKGKVAQFYIIWKLHKPADAHGCRSRPILSCIDYITGQASNFLHEQLKDLVFRHHRVLRNTNDLIHRLEEMELPPTAFLNVADVAALYPSIETSEGLKALRWFMQENDFDSTRIELYISLAEWILTNNVLQCKGKYDDLYRQVKGTAMGTSFSVTYAIIYMLYLENQILPEFSAEYALYGRYIDDIFLIWTGDAASFVHFRERFNQLHPNIKLDWQHVINPDGQSNFDPAYYRSVNFMDLRCKLLKRNGGLCCEFSPYSKPNNAYSYIPFDSFQPEHQKFGWIKAELLRLLTHCSRKETWSSHICVFAGNLLRRGYPLNRIKQAFRTVKWTDRPSMLEGILHKPQFYSSRLQGGNVFVADFRPGYDGQPFLDCLQQQELHETNPSVFARSLNVVFRGGKRLSSSLPIINYHR
jgi:hypothetical protein